MAEDYKFNLSTCKKDIAQWRKSYMRLNSKYKSSIQLRCFAPPADMVFWKFYLELFVNGELKEQVLITREAFDALDLDPELKREHYQFLDVTVLYEFYPSRQLKKLIDV